MKILMDMDGVVSEWIAQAAHLFGLTREQLLSRWTPGEADIEHALGIGTQEMWSKVDSEGEDFWAEMPETPWARRLYEQAQKIGQVIFLTSPSHHPCSLAGKLRWLKKFTGNPRFRDFLIGPRKDLCAGPEAILVDDHDGNLSRFEAAGGRVVCFPRRWNKMHGFTGDPCEYALKHLARYVNIPANNEIARSIAALDASGDSLKASLADLYANRRDEMNDLIMKAKSVTTDDLPAWLSGACALIAKDEHLKGLAMKRLLNTD